MSELLIPLGWNDHFQQAFSSYQKQGYIAARIMEETKINYLLATSLQERTQAILAGRLWNEAPNDASLPTVGDWVAFSPAQDHQTDPVIQALLPRETCFSRKAPGKSTEEQVIAANVHTIIVVTDAGNDYNPRRLERYLTLIEKSEAKGIILINKADLYSHEKNQHVLEEIQALSPQTPVWITSALHQDHHTPHISHSGLQRIQALIKHAQPGHTLTFVGSSGVGKSTLVNALLERDTLPTGEVNTLTGKGRHTTTWRELIPLPHGGLIVDNPGMREIHMWTDESTLRDSFSEVEHIASQCQFHDCKHQSDQGCAIRKSVQQGILPESRYQSYLRLEEEIQLLLHKQKKRRMTIERRAKRKHKIKHRNLADRIDYEDEQNPHWR